MNDLKFYEELISRRVVTAVTQEIIDKKISMVKDRLHEIFVKNNKGFIMFLDVLIILGFLMNFGALFITNALIFKPLLVQEGVVTQVDFVEINPVSQESFGVSYSEPVKQKTSKVYELFIVRIFVFGLLFGAYWYCRRSLMVSEQLTSLSFIVFLLFLVLAYDFINDAGYYAGYLVSLNGGW